MSMVIVNVIALTCFLVGVVLCTCCPNLIWPVEKVVNLQKLKTPPENGHTPEFMLSQIANGHRELEQELVSRYWRGLYFVLFQRTQDSELAADLAQDTLLIVIEKAREGAIEKPLGLATFIKQVGINLMIAHFRKEKRRVTDTQSDIDVYIPDDSPSLYKQFESQEMLAIVRQLLDELTVERDRKILSDHFIYHKDKHEICLTLGLSSEHFDRVLQRARARLKQLVYMELNPDVTLGKGVPFKIFGPAIFAVCVLSSLIHYQAKEHYLSNLVGGLATQRHLVRSVPVEQKLLLEKTIQAGNQMLGCV